MCVKYSPCLLSGCREEKWDLINETLSLCLSVSVSDAVFMFVCLSVGLFVYISLPSLFIYGNVWQYFFIKANQLGDRNHDVILTERWRTQSVGTKVNNDVTFFTGNECALSVN